VDWRENINTPEEDRWERIGLSQEIQAAIGRFMADMGLLYGRLDFILDEVNDRYWFLEVNANGQFGWLDDESLWLHGLFLDAVLNKSNVIRSSICMQASWSA
jgi:glutathione synthase/RimK-type ligase-like ATP-grasp enzyme